MTADQFHDVPERITPYIISANLDEQVHLLSGPFRLIGSTEAVLHADLNLRWSPSVAIEFDGTYDVPFSGIEGQWTLMSEGDINFSVPVIVTQVILGSEASAVRGIAASTLNIGRGPFRRLRFCLANFPSYRGKSIHFEHEGMSGLTLGRLEVATEEGVCQIDTIPESKDLVEAAERNGGFVISHVGEWIPATGVMSAKEAESILGMLHFWFGLLRGAWAGPLFPQGINDDQTIVWRQFDNGRLRESRQVATWLPERAPLDLSKAFHGFVQRWNEDVWRDSLVTSISWFVEANAIGTANESRVVLAQVALELLSWVLLVEEQRLCHPGDFEKISAAGRIRALLHHVGVPTDVPGYLDSLQALCDVDAFDGPGIIAKVRNALVHPTKKKRVLMESVNGEQRMECAQLALQYLDLVILAVCGHDGYYSRRGWRGWKGIDNNEVRVPWKDKREA